MDNAVHIPIMRTIKETAELFHLPVHFVRQKVNSGEVVAVRAGRKYLVNIERFADYLDGAAASSPENPRRSNEDYAPRISPIPLR